jgi:hypothetical protein
MLSDDSGNVDVGIHLHPCPGHGSHYFIPSLVPGMLTMEHLGVPQVQELGDVLDVHMDHCDEAMRIFKSHMDSKAGASASGDSINLLAVAAIALAQLDSGLQADLAALSQASGISFEEIENVGRPSLSLLMVGRAHSP